MNNKNSLCQYQDPDNSEQHSYCCQQSANNSGFCYWYGKLIDKSGPKVKEALMAYAKSGGMAQRDIANLC